MTKVHATIPATPGRGASDNVAPPPPSISAPVVSAAAAAPRPSLGTAVARGIAICFAAFSLMNVLIELRLPGYNANLWWIDFAPLSPLIERAALLIVSGLLIAYAFAPVSLSPARRRITRTGIELLWVILAWDTFNFFGAIARGKIHATFPLPFTVFVAAALWAVWVAAGSARPVRGPVAWVTILLTIGAVAILFPLLQMLCFGLTDYRRAAAAAVVFGARVYDDGTPSDALRDRTQLGVDLYNQKLVMKLIFSGGPDEVQAMRRMALDAGVKPEDVITDANGLNTAATVTNVIPKLDRIRQEAVGEENEAALRQGVLAVSHFYHLPRIKMAFAEEGLNVYTVPVREPLMHTPKYMAREVAALWKYYLDGMVR